MTLPRVTLALVLAAGLASPAAAGRRISDQMAVRRTVHRYLVRMGHLPEGPYYEQSMNQALDEMVVDAGPFTDLVLETLGLFLRNPETDFGECTVAYCFRRFAAGEPDRAAKVLLRGLPARDRAGDRCVADALVRVGPPAYPALLECARTDAGEKASWCLTALLDQSRELPDVARILDAVGGEPAAGAGKGAIRGIVVAWSSWWDARGDDLRWDETTRTLREKER